MAAAFWLMSLVGAADAPPPVGETVVFDFAADDEETDWRTVDDDVMGGVSSSEVRLDDGRLVWWGEVSLENQGGFASVRSPAAVHELGSYDALRIRLLGDGHTYDAMIRLRDAFRDVLHRASFETTEGEWQEVTIPFRDFRPSFRGRSVPDAGPVKPDQIGSFGFLIARKQAGPFRMEFDWLRAVDTRVALRAHQWRHRLLLLFAPGPATPAMDRQDALLAGAAAGFDERDLVTYLVYAEGDGVAGDHPLLPEEAAALRERFDVAPGDFTAILVGKDGTVKHRAGEPVEPATLYRIIDAMPMRQREMAGQDGD